MNYVYVLMLTTGGWEEQGIFSIHATKESAIEAAIKELARYRGTLGKKRIDPEKEKRYLDEKRQELWEHRSIEKNDFCASINCWPVYN